MAFGAAAIVLIGVISARGADMPSLLILPLDMVDTSGETPSRAQEHEDRLVALAQCLSQALAHDGSYVIIDPGPISGQINKARTVRLSECNGCELDLARLVHADRVLTRLRGLEWFLIGRPLLINGLSGKVFTTAGDWVGVRLRCAVAAEAAN
jgi:hypothetical protein